MKTPLISVIMPVYNGEQYLKKSIESILNQSNRDFEFIIINDGSTDRSEQIIKSYKDKRIVYLKNHRNLKLVATLNKGLSIAQGKYIARMDADDISLNERLNNQITFLENNPDYGVVGCYFAVVDGKETAFELGGVKLREDNDLKIALALGNIFAHGEIMVRNELIKKYKLKYRDTKIPVEDYRLWIDLAKHTKFKVLPEILYLYRIQPNSISSTRRTEMEKGVKNISHKYSAEYLINLLKEESVYSFYKRARSTKDNPIKCNNNTFNSYERLSYQVFLFRIAKQVYAKKTLLALELVTLSFLLNPLNWLRKILKTFPNTSHYYLESNQLS